MRVRVPPFPLQIKVYRVEKSKYGKTGLYGNGTVVFRLALTALDVGSDTGEKAIPANFAMLKTFEGRSQADVRHAG